VEVHVNTQMPPRLDPPQHEFDLGGELSRWLGRIDLGPPQWLGPLEISPLVLAGEPGEPFLLLHEAIQSGALEVTEQGEGNVSELVAHNRGNRPILILEGESVRGAKQNRVITVDVLVAAGASATVFVGCVEQGRWHGSKGFSASAMPVEPRMRAANKAETLGGAKINQGRLWRTVARRLVASGVESDSSSYLAFIDSRREESERRARALAPLEGQVGILALDRGRLVGLDLLGHPRNWGALAHRLASSYVLGSLDDDDSEPAPRERRSRADWLKSIAAAPVTVRPAAGLGQQVALSAPGLVGGGLWHEGRPAHLAVFGAAATAQPGHWVPIT
jgi:hypothetical protein